VRPSGGVGANAIEVAAARSGENSPAAAVGGASRRRPCRTGGARRRQEIRATGARGRGRNPRRASIPAPRSSAAIGSLFPSTPYCNRQMEKQGGPQKKGGSSNTRFLHANARRSPKKSVYQDRKGRGRQLQGTPPGFPRLCPGFLILQEKKLGNVPGRGAKSRRKVILFER